MNGLRLALLLSILLGSSAFAAETWRNNLDMNFVRITAGSFVMGNSQADETAFELPDGDVQSIQDETPAHPVRISRDFWLGATEVTQAQWLKLMSTRPGPAALWRRSDWQRLPVVSISWNDAQHFIRKLNAQEKPLNENRITLRQCNQQLLYQHIRVELIKNHLVQYDIVRFPAQSITCPLTHNFFRG